jgi:hypothetical protein
MSWKQIGLGLVLIDFAAFTGWVIWQHGYTSFFAEAAASAVSAQVLLDLGIALSMVSVWMIRDAQERGVSVVPYLLLTLTLGSIGPLLYLVRRMGATMPSRARTSGQAVRT